jgi:hypothetical protein
MKEVGPFASLKGASRRGAVKIIFLDIDGVLCTSRSHLAFGRPGGMMLDWDPTCVALVKRLCDSTGARLVISSTWRHDQHHPDLFAAIDKHGLRTYLYANPDRSEDWRTPNLATGFRGDEIDSWLADHPQEVAAFICLDDSLDFNPHHNLILTDFQEGFGSENFRHALKVLQRAVEGEALPEASSPEGSQS